MPTRKTSKPRPRPKMAVPKPAPEKFERAAQRLEAEAEQDAPVGGYVSLSVLREVIREALAGYSPDDYRGERAMNPRVSASEPSAQPPTILSRLAELESRLGELQEHHGALYSRVGRIEEEIGMAAQTLGTAGANRR